MTKCAKSTAASVYEPRVYTSSTYEYMRDINCSNNIDDFQLKGHALGDWLVSMLPCFRQNTSLAAMFRSTQITMCVQKCVLTDRTTAK